MMHRLSENLFFANTDNALTGAGNGSASPSMAGYWLASAMLSITTAASTGTYTVQAQVSATGSSGWTNFGSPVVYGAGLTDALYIWDFQVQDMIQTLAGAAYVRFVISAVTGSMVFSSAWVLGEPLQKPPTQTNTVQFPGHTL